MKGLSIAAFLLALDLLLVIPERASAFYYDPGFGSIVTQGVFATWLAAFVVIGRYRNKLGDFLQFLKLHIYKRK